jgi:hypothetical protein
MKNITGTLQYNINFCFRCGIVEIPKKFSIEIDTPFDLLVAEAQLDAHSFL